VTLDLPTEEKALKRHRKKITELPKLDRVDKLTEDVKVLKSLVNLIIKKLETRG